MADTSTQTAPEPLFVIALPKSYTTVLGGILGQHPGVMGTPELNLFVGATVRDWAMQPGSRIFCDGLLRTVAQLIFGEQTAMSVQQSLSWLEERADWPVQQLFDLLREAAAPAVMLDQSPLYSQRPAHLQRILAAYPKARIIHLLRNPVAWVRSMEKWGVHGEQVLAMYSEAEIGLERALDPLEIWHLVHSGVADIVSGLPEAQVLTVWGEDAVTRPQQAMARILDWLGLDHDPALLDEMLHPERSVFACWGPPGARGGNNPDFLSDPRLRLSDDRERLMRIDTGAMDVPDEILRFARAAGYE